MAGGGGLWAGITLKGAQALAKELAALPVKQQRALSTAIKIKAAALTRQLISEIRSGSPGGASFRPLSVMATRRASRFTTRGAFTRLSSTAQAGTSGATGWSRGTLPVRYSVSGSGAGIYIRLGFVDTPQAPLSRSWKRLLTEHQEGFSRTTTRKQREWARDIGIELSGYGKTADVSAGRYGWQRKRTKTGRAKRANPKAKYFLWRKDVTLHKTPARPIIVPFWEANKEVTWREIRENYIRKLRGERI